jgi:hypothetical protein
MWSVQEKAELVLLRYLPAGTAKDGYEVSSKGCRLSDCGAYAAGVAGVWKMKVSDLIEHLEILLHDHGDQDVVIDTGMCLCECSEVDLGASDEGVIIWAGDLVDTETV